MINLKNWLIEHFNITETSQTWYRQQQGWTLRWRYTWFRGSGNTSSTASIHRQNFTMMITNTELIPDYLLQNLQCDSSKKIIEKIDWSLKKNIFCWQTIII